jgi:hypothetical protein
MMRISLAATIFAVASLTLTAPGAWAYDYQLYKNAEKFGIVVFPKAYLSSELDGYIHSIAFEPAESGKAVMRYGTKGENETFMMPEEVQARHGIEKFIVIQVLQDRKMLVGVYDTEWGLTLPSSVFELDQVKENIPKTLNVFRGDNPQRQTRGPGDDHLNESAAILAALAFPTGGPISHAHV